MSVPLSGGAGGAFATHHPDPIVLVTVDGRIGWANAAAGPLLQRWSVEPGDAVPQRIRQELAAVVATGDRRGVLVGYEGDPVFEAHVSPEGGVWLHAHPPGDELSGQVRAARRAKSAFLSNMSHELRTPLNAILGYVGLLREDADNQDLRRVERAANHLLGLVDDLLEVSRIEAGRIGLFVETFALEPLLLEVVDTLRPFAAERGQTVDLDARCEPLVRSDRAKLRQIAIHLVDHAVRLGRGPIVLTVRTARGDHDELLLRVGVPGADADPDPFAGHSGGLGLALARLLAGLLGGRCDLVGKGDGAMIEVAVPVRVDAGEGPTPVGAPIPVVGPPTPHGTVLVVDDDPASRDLLARYLVREGWRVASASDGEAGLRAARELRPDVITLDLVMPHVDGWEVLRRLKQDPDVGGIPVVVASIVDESGLGFTLGASGYLTKPIDRAELLRTLAPFGGGGRRVLVVDDDPDHRSLVSRTLTRAGWTVEEAPDGASALAQLDQQRPDVILLDLLMPGMDGFQVVEAIRQKHGAELPVIVVTAMTLGPAETDRLQSLVQGVVGKSGLGRLVEEMRAALRR